MNHARATNPTFQVKIGDLELTASKLDLNKIGQIEEWAQGQVMALARRGIAACPDMPTDERRMIYDGAMEKARGLSFTNEDGGAEALNAKISTLEGLRYVIWLCCVDHRPDLTEHEIGAAVLSEQMVQEVNMILEKSGLGSDEAKGLSARAGRTKSAARPRRRKKRASKKGGSR